ncbi:MAG: sulfatase-like hydrolase/transferase [Bacteroidota bacterium]
MFKKVLIVFIRYFFFWLVYFWVSNIVFLLANYRLTGTLEFSEIAKILILGTKMDLSMAGYLTVLPGILIAFSFLFSSKKVGLILKIYTLLLLIIATFLNIIDLGLYPHWGTRVGINAFDYIGDMKGVMSNFTFGIAVTAVLAFSANLFLFMRFFKLFIFKSILKSSGFKWFKSPVLLFLTASLIIPIRGSFNTSPMNLSFVAFSDNMYVNQAASNYLWHFLYTVDKRDSFTNPCIYFENNKAENIFSEVERNRVYSDSLLLELGNPATPNVVLVILESFSNKIIPALGGNYNVCPNINSLCDSSIVFSSFYASGNRSDRGISAILGGYPSLLEESIMRFPDKSDKLTLLSHYFNRNGYKNSFYYGGDIDFFSMKSILLQGDYDEIISQGHFPRRLSKLSKWGVPDEYLFSRLLAELKNETGKFLKIIYTLSSHPPFDVPFDKIKGNSNESKYLNSVAYTDSCLGAFISGFKETDLWENTLVIITSDHGYIEPGPTDVSNPESYRIPLIWTGGVVQKPMVIDIPGGQPDFIPTLVRQLGWEYEPQQFGHDLFSSPSFAFYMHDSGWGYVTKENKHFFSRFLNRYKTYGQYGEDENYFDFPKAYLQVLHNDFLKK